MNARRARRPATVSATLTWTPLLLDRERMRAISYKWSEKRERNNNNRELVIIRQMNVHLLGLSLSSNDVSGWPVPREAFISQLHW